MKQPSNDSRRGNSQRPAKAASSTSTPATRGRLWVFRLFALVIIPLVFLGGLELLLRMAGYGHSTGLFKKIDIGGRKFYVESEDFSLRFFPPELARYPGPVKMKADKPPDTFRIFILGESAAMGDPEPAYGPARYLEMLLREKYPGKDFEIINVAFTAINSHVILPIARECARHQGDLWIIYMGNNEMVGPYGAATIFGPKAPPLAFVRLNLAAQKTRIGQLLLALERRLHRKSSTPAAWGGMEMFAENRVQPGGAAKEAVYRNFERNLKDILEAGFGSGANILLNTVAVNLKDCPPFASESNTNLGANDSANFEELFAEGKSLTEQANFAVAAHRFERAAALNPDWAEVQFRLGDALVRLTNSDAARQHFQSACDLDALPFRTDSRLNSLIRQAVKRTPGTNLVLLDAAGFLSHDNPAAVPGDETFYEHVHFNFDGNYRLARAWAEQIERFLPSGWTNSGKAWAPQETCERRLGLMDWNRSLVIDSVIRRMQQPPLSSQFNNTARLQALQAWRQTLHRQMTSAGAANAREIFQEALKRAPDDHYVHENFATFLVTQGDLPRAVAEWQRVHELIPQDYLADFRLGELLADQGKLAEAKSLLQEAIAHRPFVSDPWLELGKIHAQEGKLDVAITELAQAQRLRPQDPECYYHIGRTLARLNRQGEAIEQLRQAVQLNPDYWQAHDALGGLLGLGGDLAEARHEFEQVVRLQPGYAKAHLNLGVALLKQGQQNEAAAQFEETLRLDPTNAIAREYLGKARSQK